MKRLERVLGITVAAAALMLAGPAAHAKKDKKAGPKVGQTERVIIDDSQCWPEVGALFDQESNTVSVESAKDLSNVVLLFADGTTQRYEGLHGHDAVFAGSGENTGKALTGVWIKSGCNHSGDGPGYGQFVENATNITELPVISIGDVPGIIEPRLSEIVEVLFEVSLSEMVPLGGEPVTVSYVSRDGTATAGMDYIPVEGVLVFEPGQITATISVIVFDDYRIEAFEELFYIDLSSPQNALLANPTGTGTILDDDRDDF
ncbi:MAG: hypothetical protein HKO55_07240 [Gammaproteobacteria bacterium]|nr:hypothetical protein [Gammaproteobacteria bacterium]NNM21049.1 hypothetical protein [Gammaproteobacteria bacterium]